MIGGDCRDIGGNDNRDIVVGHGCGFACDHFLITSPGCTPLLTKFYVGSTRALVESAAVPVMLFVGKMTTSYVSPG